jgi:hypothetical protein
MTLFTSQTFEKTLDITKYLKFTKKNTHSNNFKSETDNIKIKINQNDILHNDYLIIKNLTLSLKLKTNNYLASKEVYEKYFVNQQFKLTFQFKIDNDIYSIVQFIPKQIDDFSIITNAINSLNPLYNAIEDLPALNIKILDNYSFENGFINDIQIDVSSVKETHPIVWAFSVFDFTNIFKYELKIEYSIERF